MADPKYDPNEVTVIYDGITIKGIMPWGECHEFESKTDAEKTRYPHKCPRCGGAAYIGLSEVDHYDKSKECK